MKGWSGFHIKEKEKTRQIRDTGNSVFTGETMQFLNVGQGMSHVAFEQRFERQVRELALWISGESMLQTAEGATACYKEASVAGTG